MNASPLSIGVHRTAVVHTSILAPPPRVIAFLGDLQNWKTWAPWIRAVTQSSPTDWTLETEAGTMRVRFGEPNSLGVLDHDITLESGITVFNSMRVLPNGTGSELVMVLFHRAHLSAAEFQQDVLAVTDDVARIKKVLDEHVP